MSNFGYVEAGLPNITGHFNVNPNAGGMSSGAFKKQGSANTMGFGGSILYNAGVDFNASWSNSTYNDNVQTVQPPALKCRAYTYYA